MSDTTSNISANPSAANAPATAPQPAEKKHSTLDMAGYGYLLGDLLLFGAGAASGKYKEAFTGLIWGAGGLALARYGNPPAERKLNELYGKLGEYMRRQGYSLPDGSTLQQAEVINHPGFWGSLENFLYKHSSEVLNAVYAIGAISLIKAGLEKSPEGKRNLGTLASGILVAAGGLAGIVIPEDPNADPSKETNPLSKAWAWARQKPLRVSGNLYTLNNASLTYSAYRDFKTKPGNYSYVLKLGTVASYVVANTLLGKSSRNSFDGKADPALLAALEQASAEVIAAQNPAMQDAIIRHTAAYMAGNLSLGVDAQTLSAAMRSRVAEVAKQNAMTAAAGASAPVAATPAAQNISPRPQQWTTGVSTPSPDAGTSLRR